MPDLWSDEFAFINQPGQIDIQTELFYDYRTNVESYPKWNLDARTPTTPSRSLGKVRFFV